MYKILKQKDEDLLCSPSISGRNFSKYTRISKLMVVVDRECDKQMISNCYEESLMSLKLKWLSF